ncbi:MAG: NAD-glutamate dehydrogenase [Actinomycetales bacterium]|nr:NAD-glutamate dehydrogenase [Actinomycetales bacterium]
MGPRSPTWTSPASARSARPRFWWTTRRSRPRAGAAGTPSSRSSPTTCPSSSTRSPWQSPVGVAPCTWSSTPQLVVQRDAAGHLVEVRDTDVKAEGEFGVGTESWMHLEIDRVSDAAERAAIADELRAVLDDVRVAVEDWPKMRAHCRDLADEPRGGPP